MSEIACPACGETERLHGSRRGDSIEIACDACGHVWERNPDVCPRCGKRTISDQRVPLVQKARGTQQSIIGYRIVKECYACGHRGA